MVIRKYGRYWAVYDGATLVCICLYKKGADVTSTIKWQIFEA